MNRTLQFSQRVRIAVVLACFANGLIFAGDSCNGQAASPSKAVVMSEVVKLAQAHQSEDVIVGYIKNTGASFSLDANEVIYLSNNGVPQGAIAVLQSQAASSPPPAAAPAEAPVPPPAAPAVQQVSFESFHEQLSPYGEWIQTPDGLVWHPFVNAVWRPYYDGGHWVYTDNGWYWQSDYPWGDIAFHYGRWANDPIYGWIWVPGYEFAPSWVIWRHTDEYLGWAPLPPGAVLVGGLWEYHGRAVAVDFDFGLTPGVFTFISYDHLWAPDYRVFVVPRERVTMIYRSSVVVNNCRVDEHGRFVNEGLGRDHIARRAGREVTVVNTRDIQRQEEHTHFVERQNDIRSFKAGNNIDATRRVAATRNFDSARPESAKREEPLVRNSRPATAEKPLPTSGSGNLRKQDPYSRSGGMEKTLSTSASINSGRNSPSSSGSYAQAGNYQSTNGQSYSGKNPKQLSGSADTGKKNKKYDNE